MQPSILSFPRPMLPLVLLLLLLATAPAALSSQVRIYRMSTLTNPTRYSCAVNASNIVSCSGDQCYSTFDPRKWAECWQKMPIFNQCQWTRGSANANDDFQRMAFMTEDAWCTFHNAESNFFKQLGENLGGARCKDNNRMGDEVKQDAMGNYYFDFEKGLSPMKYICYEGKETKKYV